MNWLYSLLFTRIKIFLTLGSTLATKLIIHLKRTYKPLRSSLEHLIQPTVLKLGLVCGSSLDQFIYKSAVLPHYYSRNENLWVDGFLFDFLQKKTIDSWVRQWVIYTGFLFSERLVFDSVVRIYLDNLIWPLHDKSIFESSNVSEMLSTVMFLYFTILLLFYSIYIIYLF